MNIGLDRAETTAALKEGRQRERIGGIRKRPQRLPGRVPHQFLAHPLTCNLTIGELAHFFGRLGERAFAKWSGLEDLCWLQRDPGYDFRVKARRLNVRCSWHRPANLLVPLEAPKFHSDMITQFSALLEGEGADVLLQGWVPLAEWERHYWILGPPRYHTKTRHFPWEWLRPMEEMAL